MKKWFVGLGIAAASCVGVAGGASAEKPLDVSGWVWTCSGGLRVVASGHGPILRDVATGDRYYLRAFIGRGQTLYSSPGGPPGPDIGCRDASLPDYSPSIVIAKIGPR